MRSIPLLIQGAVIAFGDNLRCLLELSFRSLLERSFRSLLEILSSFPNVPRLGFGDGAKKGAGSGLITAEGWGSAGV